MTDRLQGSARWHQEIAKEQDIPANWIHGSAPVPNSCPAHQTQTPVDQYQSNPHIKTGRSYDDIIAPGRSTLVPPNK